MHSKRAPRGPTLTDIPTERKIYFSEVFAAASSFTFGSHQSSQQRIAMKTTSRIFNPLRLSSTLKAVQRNELWHYQRRRLRRAMSTLAMPVLRKQKDDGSGKLQVLFRGTGMFLLSSYHRGRNTRRRALQIHSIPVAVGADHFHLTKRINNVQMQRTRKPCGALSQIQHLCSP